MFSPVLVGSITGGSKVGLDSSGFNLLSKSTLSSTVLLGSFIIGFSSSSSCEFVLTMVSLACSSGIIVFSLSVGKIGAS